MGSNEPRPLSAFLRSGVHSHHMGANMLQVEISLQCTELQCQHHIIPSGAGGSGLTGYAEAISARDTARQAANSAGTSHSHTVTAGPALMNDRLGGEEGGEKEKGRQQGVKDEERRK